MASRTAPLAGKPPFATDEPDSFYESPAPNIPRQRQPRPQDPNKRSSAYDVYDNYLTSGDNNDSNRQSGIGALGMGFLNGDMDSDDDDEDDDSHVQKQVSMPVPQPAPAPAPAPSPTSKHAALAAATNPRQRQETPPPQYIASPRPGYAAPIAALNLTRPEPSAAPAGRQPQPSNPFEPTTPSSPSHSNPFEPPSPSHPVALPRPPTSPIPVPSTPHPLQPPMTPITPVFARPGLQQTRDVKFATDPSKPIMRGNSEETLLPKRGERGDDFWRRFSMIAKEENKKPYSQKESTWLKKTQSGTSRLSRWVWVVGILLIICAAGAIGLGVYASHNSPSHQQPKAIGGSANEHASAGSSSATSSSGTPGAPTQSAGTLKTSLHVSPTNTVARREPAPTLHARLDGLGKRSGTRRRHVNRTQH